MLLFPTLLFTFTSRTSLQLLLKQFSIPLLLLLLLLLFPTLSSSSFYSSVPLPMLPLRLPSLTLCFSFSSFPMALFLLLILLSQFHMFLLLALHIRSLFVISSEYFSTFDVQSLFLSRIIFVQHFTNPLGKSVILHKDTAKLICWKILKSKQLFRSISHTNLFTSSLMTFIMRYDSQRVKILRDYCLDTPRHLRH